MYYIMLRYITTYKITNKTFREQYKILLTPQFFQSDLLDIIIIWCYYKDTYIEEDIFWIIKFLFQM
jgi:hypothetical protein